MGGYADLWEALRRRAAYVKYKLGVFKSVHDFATDRRPRNISILIPDSLGDIAVNSSVTQHLKSRDPSVYISLISHPKYIGAGEFDPNYEALVEIPSQHLDVEPWQLSYARQLQAAREATPEADVLYLCQPSAWCDYLVPKMTMMQLQNHLCGVPESARFAPSLETPAQGVEAASRFRRGLRGPVVLILRESHTARFGRGAADFWLGLARALIDDGYTVLDNTRSPLLDHNRCVAVGEMPLAEVVALAELCDGVIALRNGLCDLIAFAVVAPMYVIYPAAFYPQSRTSFLTWCSLVDMGANHAKEVENSLESAASVESELARCLLWLRSLGGVSPPNGSPLDGNRHAT